MLLRMESWLLDVTLKWLSCLERLQLRGCHRDFEKIIREDIFTSIHVDEYLMEVRETKRGPKNLQLISLRQRRGYKELDENGIIRIGASVEPGDILIGKITPKGESDPSPEEKLLRAISVTKPVM